MKKTAANIPTTPVVQFAADSSRKTLHVAVDWLNTTWRIAVPVILGAAGGILLDKSVHSAPWLTIAGSVLGFVVAGLLVARLLKESESEEV